MKACRYGQKKTKSRQEFNIFVGFVVLLFPKTAWNAKSVEKKMKIERVWAMPNARTFQISPIFNLIKEEFEFGLVNVLDPFPYQSKQDCFEYLNNIPDNSFDFGVLDPPYTKRQVSEHYKKNGGLCSSWQTSSGWTAKVKREINRIIRLDGKIISFGYNSNGMGKGRGWTITRILLVAHGGDHYDTICTVEKKSLIL